MLEVAVKKKKLNNNCIIIIIHLSTTDSVHKGCDHRNAGEEKVALD